jgi:guanyl-specific ribonuclease Sa
MSRTRGRRAPVVGRPLAWLAVVLLIALGAWLQRGHDLPRPDAGQAAPRVGSVPAASTGSLPAFLPPEAHDTLRRIASGGPHPHPQDGAPFGNRERLLPPQSRGHYREYTVSTPALGHRGARRIVTGGDPPRDYYYTDDHYASFRRFEVAR